MLNPIADYASTSLTDSKSIAPNVGTAAVVAAEASVFDGRDMICFSHDWKSDPLSKTHLMRLLARRGRVLWVNSIGYRAPTASRRDLKRILQKLRVAAQPISEPEKNIFVLNPLAIPLFGSRALRNLNRSLLRYQVRRAMKKLGFSRPINWVFNPAAAIIAGELGEEALIYYCVDEYSAFSGVPAEALKTLEHELLIKANLVVTSSKRLHESKSAVRPDAVLVRHGVDFHHFRSALDPQLEVPVDVADIQGPVLGYFGLLADEWVDLPLLIEVARSFPEATMVLLGKSTMDLAPLLSLPNVRYLGPKPYATLPAYCRKFDVALIPFPISETTLNANPLKAREYLAAGLPVVSTYIPEVEAIGGCLLGKDAADFVIQIRRARADSLSREGRSERMRSEGWDARLREVDRLFASKVPR